MPDQLANDPAARDSSGAIIDQKTVAPPETLDTTTQETKPEQSTTQTEDRQSNKKPTLLNEKDETKPADKPVVPEKYEPFAVPDGFTLDEAVATEVDALFKGLNLTQSQAQSLVDFYTAKTLEVASAPYKLWADTQEAWVNEVKADPNIGPKLPAVKATISKAIDSLGPLAAPFREAMDFTGAGNNPAFIRAFYAFAERLTEGSHVSGRNPSSFGQSAPGGKPASAAAAMYPGLPSGR